MRSNLEALARPLHTLTLVAAALSLLLGPLDAAAQLGRPQFRSAPKLTSSDLAIIRELVREDLTGKPNGTTLSWQNPESSNSGSVTLLEDFTSQGRECRRVRYVVTPGVKQPAAVKPNTYVLNNCRLADGSWKIDSAARPDRSYSPMPTQPRRRVLAARSDCPWTPGRCHSRSA